MATVTAMLGVLRAWLHVTSPLVISNHVTHADFPGAYALFMLSAGLINVTFSPLIGKTKILFNDAYTEMDRIGWSYRNNIQYTPTCRRRYLRIENTTKKEKSLC